MRVVGKASSRSSTIARRRQSPTRRARTPEQAVEQPQALHISYVHIAARRAADQRLADSAHDARASARAQLSYREACIQHEVSPEPTLVDALAKGSARFSTRALAMACTRSSPLFSAPPSLEATVLSVLDGVRAAPFLHTLELVGFVSPGGLGSLWSARALMLFCRALVSAAPHVRTLSLAKCALEDAHVEALAPLLSGRSKHLTSLDVSANDFEHEFARALPGALRANRTLVRLDVSNCPRLLARSAWATELGDALTAHAAEGGTLTEIRASVPPSSVPRVLTAVGASAQLRSLGLTHARLSAAATATVLKALAPGRPCGHVHEIDLNFCFIGDDGAVACAEALRAASAPSAQRKAAAGHARVGLRKLALANCAIYARGGLALLDALGSNETVEALDLSGNPLGDAFALPLARLLRGRTAAPLVEVLLSRTFIGDAGVHALRQAAHENTALIHFGELSQLPALLTLTQALEWAARQNALSALQAGAGTQSAPLHAAAAAQGLPASPSHAALGATTASSPPAHTPPRSQASNEHLYPSPYAAQPAPPATDEEEAALLAELSALRAEVRRLQLLGPDSGGGDALLAETERAHAEAEQAAAMLDDAVRRNHELQGNMARLERQLQRLQSTESLGGDLGTRGAPQQHLLPHIPAPVI